MSSSPSFLAICFGSVLKVLNVFIFPILFAILSTAVNNRSISISISIYSLVVFLITFLPSFVRAGVFKGTLAFILVVSVKYAVGIAYMLAYASFGVSNDVKSYMVSKPNDSDKGAPETQAETPEDKKRRLSKEERYAVAVIVAERISKEIALNTNFLLQVLDLSTMALSKMGATGPRNALDKSLDYYTETTMSRSVLLAFDPNLSAKCKARAIMTYGEAPCDMSKSRGWTAQWDAVLDKNMSTGCKARQIFTLGYSKCREKARTLTKEQETPITAERFSTSSAQVPHKMAESVDPGLQLMNEERFKY
eukprot:jgi/Mesvir1/26758/Mv20534-RA.1